jgi:hypothetical protein
VHGGEHCYFKIDYYAKGDREHCSEDPADRVMTIVLVEEY